MHAGHPGFAMMSLDGSVYICASTGETGIAVLVVRHPDRSEDILRILGWTMRRDGLPASSTPTTSTRAG